MSLSKVSQSQKFHFQVVSSNSETGTDAQIDNLHVSTVPLARVTSSKLDVIYQSNRILLVLSS